ncbi:protein-export chaperone SecB [Solimonas sp. K1W22B-7]|uniref:protein-export chaperone SecB n=1 Tax=Solimonas sp. K1W22B-7 TaxID=2303331 RepID=UPI000E3348F1|nr:protein-export chaperone SecB [Solimonas sp. K1W22B-7]AXQ27421.1 protein-export chaperone SecB [Solimonas sp. K1W22B-7]
MTEETTPNAATPGAAPARQVLLQKIYLKDASLEVPLAPDVFTRQWQPQLDVQVNTELKTLPQDHYQLMLSVTVTAKLGEDVAFLAEVHQAGIFVVRGFDNAVEKHAVLGAFCPGQVFPFARDSIADLVQRGGFPQLLLQPINFEALYLEHQQKAARPQAEAHGAAAATH